MDKKNTIISLLIIFILLAIGLNAKKVKSNFDDKNLIRSEIKNCITIEKRNVDKKGNRFYLATDKAHNKHLFKISGDGILERIN